MWKSGKIKKITIKKSKYFKKYPFFRGEMFECITSGGAVISMESYLP